MSRSEVNTSIGTPLVSRIPPEACGAWCIVDTFAAKAREVGIRSVGMGDLAKQLRISKKTLYKYFSTKEDLVYELVVRWENRFHEPIDLENPDVIDLLKNWVELWLRNDGQYSGAFWLDLRSDYPNLYNVYASSLYARMNAMKSFIKPYLYDDCDIDFAWSAYRTLISNAARPKMFAELGLSREACVQKALDFWIKASLDLTKVERYKKEKTGDQGTKKSGNKKR